MIQNNMKVIGITGGIGSGKSKVISYLKENYSCIILKADDIANNLKNPGELCYEPIVSLFGNEILNADGTIDNQRMASLIFSNHQFIEQVNDIIHPAVKQTILNIISYEKEQRNVNFIFIEAALLIEAGYQEIVDEMWYVYTDEDTRRNRLKQSRGYSDQKIDQIMHSQLSEEQFKSGSNFILDNSGKWEATIQGLITKMEEYPCKKNRVIQDN